MFCSRLRVKNVGPFAAAEFDFCRGSVGIFGRNGSGKSTILNLLFAALSNDFGRFHGVKADCARSTAGPKEESWFEATATHVEVEFTVRRCLRPQVRSELSVGADRLTDANKIAQRLDELLGVGRKMLDLYVFKSQDRIYDFLSTTPAQRASAYQVLCRTERCESVWEFLSKRVVDLSSGMDCAVVDELAANETVLKEGVDRLTSDLAENRARCMNAKSVRSARDIVRRHENTVLLERKVSMLAATLAQLRRDAFDAGELYRRGEQVYSEALVAVRRADEEATAAREALHDWEVRKRLQTRREALTRQRKSIVFRSPPAVVDGYVEGAVQSLAFEIANLSSRLSKANSVLSALQQGGVVECPVCGTPVSSLANCIDEQSTLTRVLPSQLAARQRQLEMFSGYESRVRLHALWLASYRSALDAIEISEKEVAAEESVAAAPVGNEADLRATIKRQSEAREAESVACSRREELRALWQAAEVALADTLGEVNGYRSTIAEEAVDADLLTRVRARLAEHERASLTAARLEGELDGAGAALSECRERLASAREAVASAQRKMTFCSVVSRVRDLFARDGIPHEVARRNLSRMERHINRGLDEFGGPFRVVADESLSFVAYKPGEPPQPASRLSTGQKVVLAMAFWPSVASLWGHDLGMLALDEPTASLDDENRRMLSSALETLSRQVRGVRQVLVVSHDRALMPDFDQVIDLDAGDARGCASGVAR